MGYPVISSGRAAEMNLQRRVDTAEWHLEQSADLEGREHFQPAEMAIGRAQAHATLAVVAVLEQLITPPRGSRLAETSGSFELQQAIESFQDMFDRRPTVAELAAMGFGIEAARG